MEPQGDLGKLEESDLSDLSLQPAGVPWPTKVWPRGDLAASGADVRRVAALIARAFDAPDDDLGETHAVLAVQGGRLVLERYAADIPSDSTRPSWSVAKSLTHALVGLVVSETGLDVAAPADVPTWRGPGDARGQITLDHLLRMSSGLAWVEDYEPGHPSDVLEMLFGAGKSDVARFAADKPLIHPPGKHFYYSSGTTNIIASALARRIGLSGDAFAAWMGRRLFAPLGMVSPVPRLDAAGTFIGSSFCFCTAEDFARFGLFYARDGVWEGRRLLPEGWVAHARRSTPQQMGGEGDGPYGAHWWLDRAGPGSFSACGYEGQHIAICPDRDLVIVRLGVTPLATQPAAQAWVADLAEAFR